MNRGADGTCLTVYTAKAKSTSPFARGGGSDIEANASAGLLVESNRFRAMLVLVDGGACGHDDALLIHGERIRACALTSRRPDAAGCSYYSFSADTNVAAGDAVLSVATNRLWRVIRVVDEQLGGITFQRRVYLHEEFF